MKPNDTPPPADPQEANNAAGAGCMARLVRGSFTPGPWLLHPTTRHPAVRSMGTAHKGPKRICTVGTMSGDPIDKGNARLIAAAPEMFDVILRFLRRVETGETLESIERAAVDSISSANAEIRRERSELP